MPAVTSLLLGLGVAASAAGTIGGMSAAKNAAGVNQDIAAQQMRQEQLRQQAMELDAKRKSLETVRQSQIARSTALATATNQGAGGAGSSGLQGGYGQIGGNLGMNLVGINQGLDLGRQNFALSNNISQDRMSLASIQGQAGMWSGLGSLGGSLVSAASVYGKMSQGFGGGGSPYGAGYNATNAGTNYL